VSGTDTPGSPLHGAQLLRDPLTTKGVVFSWSERVERGLVGLLPCAVNTLAEQIERTWHEHQRQATDLDKHVYLRALQDRNEVLFHALLAEHIEETMPLVYTPTVAEGCRHFSELWRRPRGLYLSWPERDHLDLALANRPQDEVDVIVVTDGQRILGIGDQGVGGMGIPVGKLTLYSLIGGIHPGRTLPIVLDVGTDNAALLDDPAYLGWRHARIDDEDYDEFVDRFVDAVQRALPDVLLQWEDFSTTHALPILERHRDRLLTFNDDIQGTAAVVLGALHGATRVAGVPLVEQHVVMLGAGSAGIGVMGMIVAQMVEDGLTERQALDRCWVLDVRGLLMADRDDLTDAQRRFAVGNERVRDWGLDGLSGLADVVEHVPAGVLIGLSTAAGAFTESVVHTLARTVERPVILPLSNPTSSAEARPADLVRWTRGRALIATGSPFAPVPQDGEHGGRLVPVAQCNNVYVFPAVGLAVTAARATRVTDGMLRAAARALGDCSPALADPDAALLPPLAQLRDAAVRVAEEVAVQAVADGVAPSQDRAALRRAITATRWDPVYPEQDPVLP
jgi:malate dehydrogenase (oxaloacetate-decarboxylating)